MCTTRLSELNRKKYERSLLLLNATRSLRSAAHCYLATATEDWQKLQLIHSEKTLIKKQNKNDTVIFFWTGQLQRGHTEGEEEQVQTSSWTTVSC